MFTLKSTAKRNKSFLYHIEVKVSDKTYFVEMRKQKLTNSSIYLACSSTNCNAKIILTVTAIPIVKVSKCVYKFGANTTDKVMLQTSNYGDIFHHFIPKYKLNKVSYYLQRSFNSHRFYQMLKHFLFQFIIDISFLIFTGELFIKKSLLFFLLFSA